MNELTYKLETDEEDDKMRGLKQLTKFTYSLETGEEEDQMSCFKNS